MPNDLPIRLAAILGDVPLKLLAGEIDTTWTIRPCLTTHDVVVQHRESPFDVVVLAPIVLADAPEAHPAQLQRFPWAFGVPIVVFASTELQDFRRVKDAAVNGWRFELAIWSRDGTVDGVGDAITHASVGGLGAAIATQLIESSKGISPESARFIRDSFRRPHAYSSAESTISHSDRTCSALNSSLKDSSVGTFKVIRRSSRIAGCYRFMKRFGLPAAVAAKRVGYGSVDSFERDVKRLDPGLTPGSLIEHVTEIKLIQLLSNQCLMNPPDDADGSREMLTVDGAATPYPTEQAFLA